MTLTLDAHRFHAPRAPTPCAGWALALVLGVGACLPVAPGIDDAGDGRGETDSGAGPSEGGIIDGGLASDGGAMGVDAGASDPDAGDAGEGGDGDGDGDGECSVLSPTGACPGARVCWEGGCVIDLDPGTSKAADAAEAWADVWTAIDEGYGAFDAKPELDWEAVFIEVNADIEAASTDLEAAWAMVRGVERIGDGHTALYANALCAVDPGHGANLSNTGACLTEVDEGLAVYSVTPTNPMGLQRGDVVLAIDGRDIEAALHDLDRQPRCTVAHSTPAMLRLMLVSSLMFRDDDDEVMTVQREGGDVVDIPIALEASAVSCDGRLGAPDVDALAHGVEHTILDGDVSYVWFPYFGAYVGQQLEDQPMIDTLRPVFEDAVGRAGMVIDVRTNGGGYPSVYNALSSWLFDEVTTLFYFRNKTGPGPDDFTDFYPQQVSPDGALQVTAPIAVLTNARSFSAADFFPGAISDNGRGPLVGAPTGGGFGGAGSEMLSVGYLGYNPIQAQNLAGDDLEGHPPAADIPLRYTLDDLRSGVDTVVERGRTYVLGTE